jgi:hypothetical protein
MRPPSIGTPRRTPKPDPARWAPWVAPSPIGNRELRVLAPRRRRRQIAEMNARTRALSPVLPQLISSLAAQLRRAEQRLAAATSAYADSTFVVALRPTRRADQPRGRAHKVTRPQLRYAEHPTTLRRLQSDGRGDGMRAIRFRLPRRTSDSRALPSSPATRTDQQSRRRRRRARRWPGEDLRQSGSRRSQIPWAQASTRSPSMLIEKASSGVDSRTTPPS